MASLPIFEIVSAASIALTTSVVRHYLALQHQYHIAANYRVVSLKYCWLNGRTILVLGNILRFFHIKETSLNTSKMFQVKEVVSWIVMGNKRWHNANLILIWNAKVSLSPKIPMLKSYKCITGIPSSNLLVVQVSILEVLKDVLPMHYHPICL